ncbi:MAG: RNA polymerase sigma factor SigJ [Verrucomicrobiota bacterium JB023]|nr:RNA polymerase sigma factor SigJ [Verrucomicrobiota bacterium JB023]
MQATAQEEFEIHRTMLVGLAYRMCGVLADAQDIVQETNIKWCSADRSGIRNPRGWLVTVCSRLAMDVMKSARVRREKYVGVWLPEPFLDLHEYSPDAQAEIDDSVSMGLMVAMERLTPSERATFLLHDVFNYSFGEIACIIGKPEATCRKSASRARRALRINRPRFNTSPDLHRQLLEAFFEAVHDGDLENLKALLADSVELHADGGGRVETAPAVLGGREVVSGFLLKIWRANVPSRASIIIENRWFNGQPGVLIYQNNQLAVALCLSVTRNTIDQIFALRNPQKLTVFMSNRE